MKSTFKSHNSLLEAEREGLGLITEGAAAARLGILASTLEGWRELGRGPMAYQISEHEYMYLESDIRTFESLCLDSFHDLHGHDRPKGVVWRLEKDIVTQPKRSSGRQSFKSWLAEQPDWIAS